MTDCSASTLLSHLRTLSPRTLRLITGQLDYQPYETLVLRRLGGDMALNCRAQSYQFVTNFPAVPFVRYPNPDAAPPPGADDMASPN